MKNLTDFRETVETGVDPRLIYVCFTSWGAKTKKLSHVVLSAGNCSCVLEKVTPKIAAI